MTQRIIYVGQDMLGRTNPGLVDVESEEYIYDFAARGFHYFYYDGDLSWLEPFNEARLKALDEWIANREPSAPFTWQEKLAAKLLCPACFLPRFIPGHKFRGCEKR